MYYDPLDPADDHKGDWWDHVSYDPEHRLALAVVRGEWSTKDAEEVAPGLVVGGADLRHGAQGAGSGPRGRGRAPADLRGPEASKGRPCAPRR